MDKNELWRNTLAALEVEISKANFAAFFPKTKLISLNQQKAVIACPSSLIAERLTKRYAGMIKETLADLTGKNYHLAFEVRRSYLSSPKPTNLGPLFSHLRDNTGLAPAYTFENFVVGLSNQLAYTAAHSVTDRPGSLHNPLLFYAGVGLGKTHLLHAIGNAFKAKDPKARIRYCPAESFTNEMIEAIQSRRTAAQFRKRFRSVDLLLVDDIQFLAGREATQEEFFNTFNQLYLSGKQIVLTSDHHPWEIRKLEARLVSRFSGGMITDIQPPDLDLRFAILKQKTKERGAALNDKIVLALAEQIVGSIRQLEGALTQLLLLVQTHRETTPEELINLVIQNNSFHQPPIAVSPKAILGEICRQFKTSKEELTGPNRSSEVVLPRQAAMYLLRELTALSLEKVGELLGGRDHSTTLYGIKTIKQRMKANPVLHRQVEMIKTSLQ